MAKKRTQSPVPRNIVQCYSLQLNRGATYVDRKKAAKAGHQKHRHAICRGDVVSGANTCRVTIIKTATWQRKRCA